MTDVAPPEPRYDQPPGTQPLSEYRNSDQRYVVQSTKVTPRSGARAVAVYLMGHVTVNGQPTLLWSPSLGRAAGWRTTSAATEWAEAHSTDQDRWRVLPRSMGKHGARKIDRGAP